MQEIQVKYGDGDSWDDGEERSDLMKGVDEKNELRDEEE